MPGRYPHVSQARDERAHGVIQDAIDKGYLDSGRKYIVPGFANHESANQGRRSITRGLDHFGLARSAWVTDGDGNQCYQDCKDPDAPHGAGFELHSKDRGRAYVVDDTGGDPAKLKWNPHDARRHGRFADNGTWIPGS